MNKLGFGSVPLLLSDQDVPVSVGVIYSVPGTRQLPMS